MSATSTSGLAATQSDVDRLVAREAIAANVRSFSHRDQARWEELRALFTADGRMSISWYDGPVDGFIEASKQMALDGKAQTKHLLAEPRVVLCGPRAISETDVTIMVRAQAGPSEVDVTSHARFLDTFERGDDGIWRVHSRTGIYEKDRIDAVGSSVWLALIYPFLPLGKYPAELKHLAFGLERSGLSLVSHVVLSGSAQEAQLKREAMAWSRCTSLP